MRCNKPANIKLYERLTNTTHLEGSLNAKNKGKLSKRNKYRESRGAGAFVPIDNTTPITKSITKNSLVEDSFVKKRDAISKSANRTEEAIHRL
jgi:hypothetical protein